MRRGRQRARHRGGFLGLCALAYDSGSKGGLVSQTARSDTTLEAELARAREQQAAISAVLRTMSTAPADLDAILHAIAENAARFAGALDVSVVLVEGDELIPFATFGPMPQLPTPLKMARSSVAATALLERRTVMVKDLLAPEGEQFTQARERARLQGQRSMLAVPLIRENTPIGAIVLRKTEPTGFDEAQIKLVETFADQAVIAIESVRLFNETQEALERQTALGEILRVISRSPSDVQPVLDAIVESALRFCAAEDAGLMLPSGTHLQMSAHRGTIPVASDLRYPNDGTSVSSRAFLAARTIAVQDLQTEADLPAGAEHARAVGYHAIVGAPLLHAGAAIGVIVLRRFDARAFSEREIGDLETFAAQAVIAIENVRLFNETRESLERQTALAEVLKVIASSPTEVKPVLDAIAENAARFCGAADVSVLLVEGDVMPSLAHHGPIPSSAAGVIRLERTSIAAAAVLDKRTIHITDVTGPEGAPYTQARERAVSGQRGLLATPLIREGQAIGAILLRKLEPTGFDPKQIKLVEAFADQAVIAIENVRLFNETKESLERQTAVSEILGVMSRSPDDLQPIIDVIAASARRFCGAEDAMIIIAERGRISASAHDGPVGFLAGIGPLDLGLPATRAILDARMIHVEDIQTTEIAEFAEARAFAQTYGVHSVLAVPMLKDGQAIGSITLRTLEVRPFTETQTALLRTFADQAVIAFENVRLFNETKEALERQTAVAEILRVISGSPTDVQPVLDAIATNALRFCAAEDAMLVLVKGGDMGPAAHAGELLPAVGRFPVDRLSVTGRSIIDRRTVHAADILEESTATEYPTGSRVGREFGERANLATPLLREGAAIGAILLRRREPRPFSQKQIDLLETFAAQAVIAIENVRLFNETRAALEQQTAVSDVLKTISQTAFDLQAVFDVVVENATKLCRGDFGYLFRRDDDVFRMIASIGGTPKLVEYELAHPTTISEHTLIGRVALEKAIVHIPDVFTEPGYVWPANIEHNVHTVAAVPIFSGGEVVAAIGAGRFRVEPYTPDELRLFETFADQAAIAMENARLFGETKESLEQQTAVAGVLEAINAAGFDQQPVLQELVDRAARLCDATVSSISLWDGNVYVTKASAVAPGVPPEYMEHMVNERRSPDRGTIIGRTALEGKTVQVNDVLQDSEYTASDMQRVAGYGSMLGVPLMRDGFPIGVFALTRNEVRPFTHRQIQLVETFAKQAVIAIENVRLFNETSEALERQTALGEILSAISASPTEAQPVFEAIARNAARYCVAEDAIVALVHGNKLRLEAHHGPVSVYAKPYEWQLDRSTVSGRSIMDGMVVQVEDIQAAEAGFPLGGEQARELGYRSTLAAPLLRKGHPIGALILRRLQVRPFAPRQVELLRAFADQAVIAIENVRLFNETKDALERQTATGEILRVISGSPTDIQPVLDAIAANAVRFCGAEDTSVWIIERDLLRLRAHHGVQETQSPDLPIAPTSITGRAVVERRTIQVADLQTEAANYPDGAAVSHTARATLSTPLLLQGRAIGGLTLRRSVAVPYGDEQVRLAETFAAQAVIAIENVRLFNETKESLDQQKAISEILQVISSSPTDIQPVLDAIARNAARYCSAEDCGVALIREDGLLEQVAQHGPITRPLAPWPVDRSSVRGRAIVDRRVIHVVDMLAEDPTEYGIGIKRARELGQRTILAAPLLREGVPLGSIALRRTEVKPFSEKQIALLRTFADQAAIAIENVRLFNETKESLERQTATAEVLKFMSSTAFDLPRVLDIVISHATRLTDAEAGFVYQVDGEELRMTAAFGERAELMRDWQAKHPIRTDYTGASTGRAFAERRTVHIPDVLADPSYTYREAQELGNFRTLLSVPLLQDDRAIGVVALWRTTKRPFTTEQIALVESFANQAVIAIENVRLFNETKESLERQTATAEILRAISGSPTDVQPVLDAIAANAVRYCGAEDAVLMLIHEGRMTGWAHVGPLPDEKDAEVMRQPLQERQMILRRDRVVGRAVLDRVTIHVPDLQDPSVIADYPDGLSESKSWGFRAGLVTPLLRQDEAIGAILLRRKAPGPFSAEQIALVETFAAQAVIAIENVRLFNETKEALERQTAVSELLKTISRTVFDLEPTLGAVVENAARLVDADVAWMTERVDAETFRWGARWGRTPELERRFADAGPRLPRGLIGNTSVMAKLYRDGHVFNMADIQNDLELLERSHVVKATAARSVMGVPMRSEGTILGAFVLGRITMRPFTERDVQLAETFADQAAIAIQNVRLFNEIQTKSRELEVANRHKSEFLANMSHELRTPLNAIIGFSEVLLQKIFGDVNPKQQEYLEDVLSSGKHLLTLINDILDLSKIEAGRMELDLARFSMKAAVDSGITIVRERAARHGIALAAAVPADLPLIEADERKVKQILYNLLSNAVKFTPDGGRVDVRVATENGDIRVDVQDTGIGIAADDKARVFEEFRQVGRERSREGTGLGLTLTKRFVELHGGRIGFESAPGKGSTFWFTLPITRPDEVKA